MMPSLGESVARAAQRWVRWFAATTAGAWLFARVLPRIDRVAFRLTGGRGTVTSTLSGALRHVVAEELTGEAREEAWQIGLQVYPGATAYAKRAGARTIGVFLLHPDNP